MDDRSPHQDDPFTAERLVLRDPPPIAKRREQFVMVPWSWVERLVGAHGSTYAVALRLLHLNWKNRGKPFKFGNGMLQHDGIGRTAKWRALADLENRDLVEVERRPGKSPVIGLKLLHPRCR